MAERRFELRCVRSNVRSPPVKLGVGVKLGSELELSLTFRRLNSRIRVATDEGSDRFDDDGDEGDTAEGIEANKANADEASP